MNGDNTHKKLTISEFCLNNVCYKALYEVSGMF
jgi:hypothetical protein